MISPKNVPGKVIEFNSSTQEFEERVMKDNQISFTIKLLDNGVTLDISQDYRTKHQLVYSNLDAALTAIKDFQSSKTEFKFK